MDRECLPAIDSVAALPRLDGGRRVWPAESGPAQPTGCDADGSWRWLDAHLGTRNARSVYFVLGSCNRSIVQARKFARAASSPTEAILKMW